MPILDTVVNQFRCSMGTDGHILSDPISLNCGGNACRNCVVETIRCLNCNGSHDRTSVLNSPNNKAILSILNSTDLFFNQSFLRVDEILSLIRWTNALEFVLLYKATRDSFKASAFHQMCDGWTNTITLIKTNSNFVFGGFSTGKWTNNSTWSSDPSAFLFSLRRNGISFSDRFMIQNSEYAICGYSAYGPIFGGGASGHDILIVDNSDKNKGSFTHFGSCFLTPAGKTGTNDTTKSFFAGTYADWLTTEIEVYRIKY